MNSNTYKYLHILITGILAFISSIAILERGSISREVMDDAFFVSLWIVGIVLLFTRKYKKVGLLLTLAPVIFLLLARIA